MSGSGSDNDESKTDVNMSVSGNNLAIPGLGDAGYAGDVGDVDDVYGEDSDDDSVSDSESSSFEMMIKEGMLQSAIVKPRRMHRARGYGVKANNTLPAEFWAFCEEWIPQFDGIQSFMLQGLLNSDTEEMTIKVLRKVMKTRIDEMIDRTTKRPLLCIIAILPYIAYIILNKPDKFASFGSLLFNSLVYVTKSVKSHGLSDVFLFIQMLNAVKMK